MMTGSRLSAPEGCGELVNGVAYHFLISDGGSNRVRLVEFDERGTRATLVTMSRLRFEAALEAGELVEMDVQAHPPWLDEAAGIENSWRESRRVNPKERYEDKVNRRLLAIAELVPRSAEILASDNPEAIINAHAKNYEPKQHPGRLRLWFFSYLVFGKSKWALLPSLHRIGTWDRSNKIVKKLGRPPRFGKNSGFPITPEMKEKILKGFLEFKRAHKTQDDIYGAALRKTFGCQVREGMRGREFFHPEGKSFPSPFQFWDWVKKQTDPASLARDLKGPSSARARSGDKGSFSAQLCNLNQLVEYDGFYPSEKISGIIEGAALDAFCVVRAVCVVSGAIVGIGFAKGRESMEAYRMALFSAAVDKVKYCELFGVTITPDQWPSVGLSSRLVFDRGPAAHMEAEEAIEWLSRLELTPVHSGQSKATVESSHPRDKQTNDQASYIHSGLNLVEMARREVRRTIKDNETSDAKSHMTEEMWLQEFAPTPLNVWKYLDERGRNSGSLMPFEQAVREFLIPLPATIRNDGVYFYGRKYNSRSLIDTGVFDRIARNGVIRVKAYSITMCVRHIWIEIEGELFELSFVYTASTKPGSADISLEDLQVINEARLRAQAIRRHEKVAIEQQHKTTFEEETGKDWDAGVKKLGRPSKDSIAQRDLEDQKRLMGIKS
ncbi:hypothetical protein [Pseudomonas fildesensis]|uniref:Transposase n=1 Tax=Pseudomonas fildesensis TaxID=1674920 RepID=A0A0J8IXB0_9PSED|nr:hypothetical protein [Pseudomonas fildesensis]KMT56571.1 transposase [Pseudomonas fildesensis]